jgi:hypothetical protein
MVIPAVPIAAFLIKFLLSVMLMVITISPELEVKLVELERD